MDFTRKEKLAIFQALNAILLADGFVHQPKVDYIAQINVQFDFYPADMDEARRMDMTEAANALRSMNPEKKDVFRGWAIGIAEADGNINDYELRLISLFFANL